MLGTTKEKTGAAFVTKATVTILDHEGLAEKLDLLTEKRSTIRVAAFNAINTTLAQRVYSTALENRQEEIASTLQHIIQRTDDFERILALRCASLVAIALSEGTQFKQQMAEFLPKFIEDETGGVSTSVRAAALDTLAMMLFMNPVLDGEQLLSATYTFSSIFYEDNVSGHVCRAAVDGWALLLSLIDDDIIEDTLFPENIDKLVELLDHTDNELRASVGKLLGMLVEALRNQLKQGLAEYETVELSDISTPISWEEITSKIESLSLEKSKAQSKVEAKKQKKIFREIITSIESGESPVENLTVKDLFLEIHGWAQIAQLDRLRSYLGEGFIHHMANNTNMMHIFDYHINPEPDVASPQMNKRERRRSLMEMDKMSTKYMDASRRFREREQLSGFASE